MFRKCFAAAVALMLVVGGLFAEDIKCKFVSYKDDTLTVKVGDKTTTYKVPADQKFKQKFKGDEKEVAASDMMKRFKEDSDVTVTVDDTDKTKVTNITRMRKMKGKDN